MKLPSIIVAAWLAASSSAAVLEPVPRDLHLAHSPPFYPSPWMDPEAKGWVEAYEKARKFVSGLTLLEKVNLTTGTGFMSSHCVGNTGTVPRLGMRSLCLQDSPLGVRATDGNSAFPAGITAGATWSRFLWEKRGKQMGAEAWGKGVDILLGPVSGPLGRAPEAGRNAEGFGSDPVLQGQALASTSVGIQSSGVIACAKHFVANEQEHFRLAEEAKSQGYNITESLSSNMDDKTMHEVYAWPFADAVRAGVGAVMCSYNQVNNSYACQNSKLLNGILKAEMGFQGFIMSDWQAQQSGVASTFAGLDMSMPGDTTFDSGVSYWGSNLTLSVLNGTVPSWRVDDMATRIMAAFFKMGRSVGDGIETNFNSWTLDTMGWADAAAKVDWTVVNKHVDVQNHHGAFIRECAAKGTVVLKNSGVLPLEKPRFLAVIGEDAGPNPKGPNSCPSRGCDNGTLGMLWGSGTAEYPYLITPDEALRKQAAADGSRYESVLSNYEWDKTRALVSQPDATAIVMANSDAGEGFIVVDGNKGDRNNLTLWKGGEELVKKVASVNRNTIVVVHSVGAVLVTDWYENPNVTAIVWAGLPGQESGNSLVDILYGKTSPGRSPFTWGPDRESYGTDVLYEPNNGVGAPQLDFREGPFIDYRYFDKHAPRNDQPGSPIYEFGFGLSWSTFEYSNLKIEKHQAVAMRPRSDKTTAAPTLGKLSKNVDDYVFPKGMRYVPLWIYPWLNSSSMVPTMPEYGRPAGDESSPAGAVDGSPQPRLASSGGQGGNEALWDVMYTVTCVVTNTGSRTTDEVAQLYVTLGGPEEPVRVLRGFERLEGIAPGKSAKFTVGLTRRDLSNWDSASQNWVMTPHPKRVWVGSSSRKLPLSADLE
ncbi:beta-glucosidase 1 precursor [Ophiocordyceps camponoti-floridani]|uniref:beta-glucosidase n=1 Tax=Ophiocordyceps camponoti-floridani TaxID=2030778 RepID=A0A8H4Q0P0_9HYPO|nr:beta-glucosidase 1 precursor [Ophiocordyceps camponoti-floridani]